MIHLEEFLNFISTLPEFLIYLALAASAFVENVFPPIPGDTVTAFGAFLIGSKKVHFLGVYISTTLGSISGFMFLFWVGSFLGRRFFIERDLLIFKGNKIIRAEKWFRKYGSLLVLLNRFLPGMRSIISISAGISRLKVLKVTILALISCSLWNLLWMFFGYVLASNWEMLRDRMDHIMAQYNFAVLVFLGLLALSFVIKKLFMKMIKLND